MEQKKIEESAATLSMYMGPQNTNTLGNVHGGVIMKMVDETAAIAAMRHARRPCVTVTVDSMTFMQPIRVGMLVTCRAELTYVGRTSMEVRVEVIAENPIQGTLQATNIAYLIFVALDDEGKPTEVPQLIFETPEQLQRAKMAQERQNFRKAQKSRGS